MNRSRPARVAAIAGLTVALLIPFALVAALVAGGWTPLHELDESVTAAQHATAAGHPAWTRFMVIWSIVFSPTGFRLAALAVAIWLWRRGAKRLVWWMVVTLTAGGLLGALLKLLVGRHRPDLLEPVARATGFSFPSGHALNAALACGVLLLIVLPFARGRRRVKAVMWAAAVLIPLVTGFSRVVLGVHWTSDVLAGWLLGVAVVAATTVAFAPDRSAVAEGIEPRVAGRA